MSQPSAAIAIHVAPHGDDSAPGTPSQPLRTLAAARDLARNKLAGAPLDIVLHEGAHMLDASVELTDADSGTADAPLTIRGASAETVRLSGARVIDPASFAAVTDAKVRDRFDAGVRPHIRQCDLKALGITDTGGVEPIGFGFGFAVSPADMDLYVNDEPLTWARWPRAGWATIDTVLHAGKMDDGDDRGATFVCNDAHVKQWSQPTNLRALGMWRQEWAPSSVPVQGIDATSGAITLMKPSIYPAQEGRHFCVYNAIEDITQPGDWAVDHATKTLYVYPPAGFDSAAISVAVLAEPLFVLNKAKHLVIRDLILEGGRDEAIVIDGDDNRVASCVIRNLGGRGVVINGSRNRVQACHLHSLGQGGVTLNGGDRRTLTPGGNVVDNCEIHNVNRVAITYNPSVQITGVGNRISHNAMYDGPHNAILLGGNDHIVEFNEFHHIAMDTDDAAAFYYGRNPSEQGNVVRYNFFHHVGSPSGWGTSAIYPDDGASGLHVHGNVFYRCGHAGQVAMGAIFFNAGKDHVVENNIFIDCRIAIGLMLQLPKQWKQFVRGESPNMSYVRKWLYEDVDINSELYQSRYPALKTLEENPSSNTVRRNVSVRCGKLVTPEEQQRVSNNWSTGSDPGFVDESRLNFALRDDSAVFEHVEGFEQIPFEQIGLRVDDYRKAIPQHGVIDVRPEIRKQPIVTRPGDTARGEITLHLANTTQHDITTELKLWTSHANVVRFPSGDTLPAQLAAGEVRELTTTFEVTATPEVAAAVGARVKGSRFSLPVPVRPRYRISLDKLSTKRALQDVTTSLQHTAALPLLLAGETIGELRLASTDDSLVLHAWVQNHPDADAAWPMPQPAPDTIWNNPYIGLLAARSDAADTSQVAQVIFFPHAPADTGTALCYHGIKEVTASDALQWRTEKKGAHGWSLSAIVPTALLGLEPGAKAMRFEAMANLMHPLANAAKRLRCSAARRRASNSTRSRM